IIGYLNGENPNPFLKHHHRRKIGFYHYNNEPVTNNNIVNPLYNEPVITNPLLKRQKNDVKSDKMTCENCGKECKRKTWTQRFCSTDCRLNFHADQHGKRFSPRMYKSRKL